MTPPRSRPVIARRAVTGRFGALALIAGVGRAGEAGGVLSVALAASPSSPVEPAFDGPIRLLVPFGPGGIADLTARLVARGMEPSVGATIIIENKPGAGGIVAGTQVASARPDGRTLLLVSNGTAVSQALFRKLPFDALTSFAPVGTFGGFPIALAVRADSPLHTVADLLAAARARPGGLNVGTVAIGSTQHLSAELFRTTADVDFTVVPFNGTPGLVTALRAGDVDLAFEILGPLMPQVNGGALRLLAVSSPRRSAVYPAVPTVIEAGVPDYEVVSWNGVAAPAGTPPGIIDRLGAAIGVALEQPAVRDGLLGLGVEPLPERSAALAERLATETARWRDVIDHAGIERQ